MQDPLAPQSRASAQVPVGPTVTVKKADGSVVQMPLGDFQESSGSRRRRNRRKRKSVMASKAPTPVVSVVPDPLSPEQPPATEPAVQVTTAARDDLANLFAEDTTDNTAATVSMEKTPPQVAAQQQPAVQVTIAARDDLAALFGEPSAEPAKNDTQIVAPLFSRVGNKKKTESSAVQHSENMTGVMEEELAEHDSTHVAVSPTRQKIMDEVMQKVEKIGLSDEQKRKVKPVIIARLKDVRDDDVTYSYAMKKEAEGGLGLNAAQAAQIIAAMQLVRSQHDDLAAEAAVSEVTPEKNSGKPIIPLPKEAPAYNFSFDQSSRQRTGTKVPMHDVVPAKPATKPVGPVEEVRVMTLTDFRRLANTPDGQADEFFTHFQTIRNESYIAYMQALKAWKESPLFRMYQNTILQALNLGQTLSEYLGAQSGTDHLNQQEIFALVALNKKL